jgi:hypothetical protein
MTALQLFIGQTGIFATENQGYLSALSRLIHDLLPAFARIQQRPGNPAITRTGAQDQIATHQRLFKGRNHLSMLEDVTGARSARIRLVMRKQSWLYQNQSRQAHVFHGTRSTADIAGMTGIDQNDTNI